VTRDIYGNSSFVNVIATNVSVATSNQTITMTAGSAYGQIATGTLNIQYNLPDATTCYLGQQYQFCNTSTGTLTVKLHDGTTVNGVLPAGGLCLVTCTDNGTTNGAWITTHTIPDTVNTWGVTGLTTGSQITSTVTTGTAPLVVASTTPVANLSIGGNAATATALNSTAVASSGITMNTNKLLGRNTAAVGAIEEITLGTNLSMAGTTLNAAGGGATGPAINLYQAQFLGGL
jgi:hypothetical protein